MAKGYYCDHCNVYSLVKEDGCVICGNSMKSCDYTPLEIDVDEIMVNSGVWRRPTKKELKSLKDG